LYATPGVIEDHGIDHWKIKSVGSGKDAGCARHDSVWISGA
jgi:hypothetical protein